MHLTLLFIYSKDEYKWFIEGFTTQEDLDKILAPALERGILRSPELTLSGNNQRRHANCEISYHLCVLPSDQR